MQRTALRAAADAERWATAEQHKKLLFSLMFPDALIRLIYESDPLLCPKCRTQMKIVSVIKDGEVIDKILAHLQYKFEPLPLAAVRPPPDTPPQWDSFSAD